MEMRVTSAGLCVLLLAGTGCSKKQPSTELDSAPLTIQLTSPAFKEGSTIPVQYTGEGMDNSPALLWTDLPKGTKSLVLLCEDPDAPGGTWLHWLVYSIPADA